MGLTNDGRVAVYMGDDVKDACVYKFISKNKYVESRGKANADLLEEGTLYVANMKKGEWVAMTIENVTEQQLKVKQTLEAKYPNSSRCTCLCG